MSDKLKYSDIADEALFAPLIAELTKVDKQLVLTKAGLTEMGKIAAEIAATTPLDSFKDIARVTGSVKKLADTVGALSTIEANRLALQKEITTLTGKHSEGLAANVTQTKELIKAVSERAKNESVTADKKEKADKKESESAAKKATASQKEAGLDKEKIRLETKLAGLADERAEANALLTAKITKQAKALRDAAKEALDGVDAYAALAKKSTVLQDNFKNLAAEFGATSKQALEAKMAFTVVNDQLQEIDKNARDGRKNVGRYELAIEGLRGGFDKLGGKMNKVNGIMNAMGIISLIMGIVAAFKSTESGGALLEKAMGKVIVTIQVVAQRLTQLIPAINLFVAKISLSFAELKNVFGSNRDEVAKLQKEYNALAANTKPLGQIFNGVGAEIAHLTQLNDKYIDKLIENKGIVAGLIAQNSALKTTMANLTAAGDDDYATLEQRAAAQKRLLPLLAQVAAANEKIALIALQEAQAAEELAFGSNAAKLATAEALMAYKESQAERISIASDSLKILNQIETDLLELQLDYSLDDLDNRKTINERILADENQTFAKKQGILNATKKEFGSALQEQSELFNVYLKKLAVNKGQEAASAKSIDLLALSRLKDTKELQRQLTASGLGEIAMIRALEVIRDYRTGVQDLTEAQNDLTAKTVEFTKSTEILAEAKAKTGRVSLESLQVSKTQAELDAKELATKAAEEAEAEIVAQSAIKRIKDQMLATKEGSEVMLQLQTDLESELGGIAERAAAKRIEIDKAAIEAQKKISDKKIEAEKKEAADAAKRQEQYIDLIETALKSQSEKRIERIDRELEAERNKAGELEALAQTGNQLAIENLALTQKKQAELERKRLKEIRVQKQAELALAAVKTYQSKVAEGDPNAFASTIVDVTLLKSFIESLPALFEGADTINDKTALKVHNGKDGYIARLHEGERVIGVNVGKAIPTQMSNLEVAQAASDMWHGRSNTDVKNNRIEQGLAEVKRAILDKPVYLGRDYNATKKAVVETIMQKNSIERRHYSQKIV